MIKGAGTNPVHRAWSKQPSGVKRPEAANERAPKKRHVDKIVHVTMQDLYLMFAAGVLIGLTIALVAAPYISKLEGAL